MGYKLKRIMMRPNGVEKQVRPSGGLPTGYTEVEYIQSTGTSETTGAVLDIAYGITTEKFEIKFKFKPTTLRSSSCYFFAGDPGWLSNERWGDTCPFNTADTTGICATNLIVNTDYDYDVLYNNGTQTVIYNNTTVTGNYSGSIIGKGANHLCFGGAGTAYAITPMLIYYIQLYDNDVLVRDFVPCKDSNNVVGMYEIVGGQFYSSVNSYTFTAGPDVN